MRRTARLARARRRPGPRRPSDRWARRDARRVPASRTGAEPALGSGGARRAGRGGRPRAALRPRRAPRASGPTPRRGSTPRPPRRSGTRRPRSTGTRPFDAARRRRGRGRPGHDVPDRERAGRARRARPLPRPDPPALPRGRAAPRGAGRGRGAPHRGVHAARPAARATTLGVSGAGGRASLQTLLDEPDFTLAGFLLSVLGEGTFLSLLSFLERHAPDPVTRQVARLALQDEARHVAFGLAHVEQAVRDDPACSAGSASPSNAGTRRWRPPPGSTRTSSTRSSCSRPANGRPTRSRGATRACSSSRRTWTTPAGAGSCGSASTPDEAAALVRPAHPQLHVADLHGVVLGGAGAASGQVAAAPSTTAAAHV